MSSLRLHRVAAGALVAPLVAPLVAFAALAACAAPRAAAPRAADVAAAPTPVDSAGQPGPPVVQVREFPSSATVAVLAWSQGETAYGLRASVRRDGTLAGDYRHGDHRLYLSSTFVRNMGGLGRVAVPPVPPGPVLRVVPIPTDYDACNHGLPCTPMETVGVQLPDAVLRATRDSLVVRFTPAAANDWTLTVRRDLIDAYLHVVDSVSASMRGRMASR